MEDQKGFTLIEIAIVLVIIGLLVGGVLKGQEMVTNARIKRVIEDFDGVAAAVYTYQDRYGSLPGDDDQANTRFTLPDGANDAGDGDGLIEGDWNRTVGTAEDARRVWLHLRAANLLPGTLEGGADGAGGNQPKNAFGGLLGIDDANVGLTGTVACQNAIPPEVGAVVDAKIDDGASDTGSLRATDDADGRRGSGEAGVYAGDDAVTICRRL